MSQVCGASYRFCVASAPMHVAKCSPTETALPPQLSEQNCTFWRSLKIACSRELPSASARTIGCESPGGRNDMRSSRR